MVISKQKPARINQFWIEILLDFKAVFTINHTKKNNVVLVSFYPNWESLHSSLRCCSLSHHCPLSRARRFSPTTTISSSPLSLSPTTVSQDLKLSPLFKIHLVACIFGVVVQFRWCRVTMRQQWWSRRWRVAGEGGDRCRWREIGIEERGFGLEFFRICRSKN